MAYHLSDLGVAGACSAHGLAISITDLAALFVDRHGEGKYRQTKPDLVRQWQRGDQSSGGNYGEQALWLGHLVLQEADHCSAPKSDGD